MLPEQTLRFAVVTYSGQPDSQQNPEPRIVLVQGDRQGASGLLLFQERITLVLDTTSLSEKIHLTERLPWPFLYEMGSLYPSEKLPLNGSSTTHAISIHFTNPTRQFHGAIYQWQIFGSKLLLRLWLALRKADLSIPPRTDQSDQPDRLARTSVHSDNRDGRTEIASSRAPPWQSFEWAVLPTSQKAGNKTVLYRSQKSRLSVSSAVSFLRALY
jgi:hypothetical protein